MTRILLILMLTTPPALAEGVCGNYSRLATATMEARETGVSEQELLVMSDDSPVAQEIVRLAFSLPEGADPEQFGDEVELVCRHEE